MSVFLTSGELVLVFYISNYSVDCYY